MPLRPALRAELLDMVAREQAAADRLFERVDADERLARRSASGVGGPTGQKRRCPATRST